MNYDIVQAALMQILAGLVNIVTVGQGFELVPVGCRDEHFVLVEQRSQLLRLCHGDGLNNQFLAEMKGKIFKQVRPDIAINDNEFCCLQRRVVQLHVFRFQVFQNAHVIDGGDEFTLLVKNRDIGAGRCIAAQTHAEINASGLRDVYGHLSRRVVSDGRDQGNLDTEAAKIMRDVAGNATGGESDITRIGSSGNM